MANFLSKLFGTKSDRDLKEVKPYLDATLKVYPEIQKLSNDQLRAKTAEFMIQELAVVTVAVRV